MILLRDPNNWFLELVRPVSVREPTKAYITGVFLERTKSSGPEIFSTALAYAHACERGTFEKFQELGDWVLWTLSFTPAYHKGHEMIVLDLGRKSYETCWRILRGQWDLYAELAEEFPGIVRTIQLRMK